MKTFQTLPRLLVTICLIAAAPASLGNESTYSFGIVPQQSAAKLARLWGPILKKIGDEAAVKIRFATAPSIPAFEERLAKGEYDFAYMNPYHFTVFNESPGYRAVARARDKYIKGIMVVKKDSNLSTLKDLDRATLAFPAPAAFAASILTRANLRAADVSFDSKYVGSHDSVYRTVAKGLYPAGGGVVRTLNNVDPAIREQLRVLWTSQGYTPHAIAAHPGVPAAVVEAVSQALLQLESSDAGASMLQAIKIKGFEAATDSDWDDVRSLELQELSN